MCLYVAPASKDTGGTRDVVQYRGLPASVVALTSPGCVLLVGLDLWNFGWFLVVRFVCAIRVPFCARVSRVCPVCPGSPRILHPYNWFTQPFHTEASRCKVWQQPV
jgi:hypothetical protein